MANVCQEIEGCLSKGNVVDKMVKDWGYTDVMPENVPQFDEVPYHVHVFVGILLLTLGVLGCLVNAGLLYIHRRLSRHLVDPSGLFLINFIICNLLVIVLQVPFSSISSLFGRWIFGEFGCQVYAGTGFIAGIASIFSFFLVVLDFFFLVIKTNLSVKYFNLAPSARGILNIKLICIQWVISMSLCVPPMFAILGRMHLEPSGTMCTIDYWHGNFKNYNLYVALLVAIGFSGPFLAMFTLYLKSVISVCKTDFNKSILSEVDLNYISYMGKFCAMGFVVVAICWGPFAILCCYTLIFGAKNLNIYVTMVPPIMAKFAPFMNGMAVIFAVPRITASFGWFRNNPTLLNVPEDVTNDPKPLWLGQNDQITE